MISGQLALRLQPHQLQLLAALSRKGSDCEVRLSFVTSDLKTLFGGVYAGVCLLYTSRATPVLAFNDSTALHDFGALCIAIFITSAVCQRLGVDDDHWTE